MQNLIKFSSTILLVLGSTVFAANESAQTFTLDGKLFSSDGITPLRDATAKIRVQVLDPAKTCVLYDEEQTVNTLNSDGQFNIQIGSAVGALKREALDSGNTMARVYQNSLAIPARAVPSQTCAGSSYTPAAGDIRYVRVVVTPTSAPAETLSPDMILDSVPSAVVAQSLQGVEKSGFLQTNPSAQLTQSRLEQLLQTLTGVTGMGVSYNGTNFVSYDPHDGGALTPGSVTDAQISSVAWAKISSVPVGISALASLACVDGKILKMVSGSWACADESGVGVESDPTVSLFAKTTPGMGLTTNGLNQIAADFGTGAGKVVQGNDSRLSDSRAPNGSATGDLSGSYPNPTVAKIQGRAVSVTAPADGQVLKYDNGTSTWAPSNFGISDLKKSNGLPQFISASCTSSQTLIWGAVTDDFSCTSISLPVAQVTGTLPIAQGGTGSTTASAALNALLPSQSSNSGKFLQTDGTSAFWVTNSLTETDPKVGANTTNHLSKWNGTALVASSVNESSGKVGINATTPAVSLDVGSNTDAIGVPRGTTAQRPATPVNGYLRYNSDQKGFEAYINGSWQQFSAGSSPSASEDGKTLRWNNTTQQFDWFTAGAAGAGIATFNGSSNSSQALSVTVASAGSAPEIVTNAGAGLHTLNIPMASMASVTAGLISKTEFDNFNGKLSAISNAANLANGKIWIGDGSGKAQEQLVTGDISITIAGLTAVNKIKGIPVSAPPTLAGQVLRYDGSANFSPAFISMADLRSQITGATALASSCAASQTLTYNSVGDNLTCSNIAITGGQVSGNIGGNAVNVTGTIAIANGGTGATVANTALNNLLPPQSFLNNGMVLRTDGTNTSWSSVSSLETDPKVGSNTTNYFSKWNGSALVAGSLIESSGNIGIGTATPGSNTKLDVNGQIRTATSSISTGSVDFVSGNNVITSYDCGANITLANIRDGGNYSIVVTGTGTTQCSFSTTTTGDDAATVSYRFMPANAVRTASSHTIYSMMRFGNVIYVSWITGF